MLGGSGGEEGTGNEAEAPNKLFSDGEEDETIDDLACRLGLSLNMLAGDRNNNALSPLYHTLNAQIREIARSEQSREIVLTSLNNLRRQLYPENTPTLHPIERHALIREILNQQRDFESDEDGDTSDDVDGDTSDDESVGGRVSYFNGLSHMGVPAHFRVKVNEPVLPKRVKR